MKRTSGAAYLAERDAASYKRSDAAAFKRPDEKSKPLESRPGWAARQYGNFLAEPPTKPKIFDPILSSTCPDGPLVAKVVTDDMGKEKAGMPTCTWWQFFADGEPETSRGDKLDLSQISSKKEVKLVALVAQMVAKETIDDASSNQGYTTAKGPSPWTAALWSEDKELVRIRRPEGLRTTGVWLVATLQRDGEGWKADAVDELYPEKRLEAVLMLRFKDFVKKEEEVVEEDPMAATRRMLEEAMA
ncbi:unnamed protein product [Effrenium voratum]|uniref:Uncharacterized protein n=1 Tax=Effrenium voratum TaxID=2562239 RepID=A0AA36IDI4_9DINO|nr:unnamed protein product [Effrenium voratum]